jgi:hypothetical protein
LRSTLLAAAVFLASGCGPAAPAAIDSFFPKDNTIGTYALEASTPTVQVAKSATAMENLIDGDAAPFIARGAAALGWAKYASGAYRLDARVWQMKSATNATETYNALVTDVALYQANTWTALSVGEAGRIADTGSSWWLNARKGAYLIEVKVTAKDATSRTDAESFAAALAKAIP